MNGLHLLALMTLVVAAWLLTGTARRLSGRHHATGYQAAVADVLLLLAQDETHRARQDAARAADHADDAQLLLASALSHPAVRAPHLAVVVDR
jgi:hypothetical protein